MSTPATLLTAIAKTAPDVGDFYLANVGYEMAREASLELRGDIAKALPDYLREASAAIRRSMGRDYIAKASNGQQPYFDPDLLNAYNEIASNWELINKLTVDEIEVNGTKFQVFRDEKGRFSRKTGGAPNFDSPDAQSDILQQFNPPGIGTRNADYHWQRKIPPGIDRTKLKAYSTANRIGTGSFEDNVSDTDKRRIAEGLHAHREANKTFSQLVGLGVLTGDTKMRFQDARKLNVVATLEGANDKDVKIQLDAFDENKGGWTLPPAYAMGYKLTHIDVTSDDPELAGRIASINPQRQEVFSFDVDALKQRSGGQDNVLDENKVRRQVRRLDMGGKLLTAIGAKKTGGAMRLAARAGGNLEDSDLRTGMTRAAYRYRGIEAPQISHDLQAAVEGPHPQDDGFRDARLRYYKQTGEPGPNGTVEASPEAIKMGQQRDYATLSLFGRMKRRESNAGMGINASTSTSNYNKLAQDIAQGIGRGMPSEGVLINRKGEIVSQSMGITNDAFTPFNAEALAQLNGGQYVRTRQLGGFSGEDIRTVLLGNGRAAQVMSNSGVYELEMDPSLRGTKRYNDKAVQMVDTYDRILDEISNGGHYAVPLPPVAEKAARSRALQRAGSDQAKYATELKAARHEQYNKLAVITPDEEKDIRAQVEPRARAEFAQRFGSRTSEGKVLLSPGMTPRLEAYVESQVSGEMDDRQQEKARMLSLNSEGYALALKTLSQYYPYMIRTARYRSWEEFNDQAEGAVGNKKTSGAADAWAAPAGYLRPKFAGEQGSREARRGLPVKRVQTRDVKNEAGQVTGQERVPREHTRITPGMSVSAGGGAGGGGGAAGKMAPEVKTMFDNRVKSLQEATRKDVSSIENIVRSVDSDKPINDATIAAAPEAGAKARTFLAWYAQNPDNASAFLASDAGKDVRDALGSKQVAQNLVAPGIDEPLTRNGTKMSVDDVQKVMSVIAATAAVQKFAGNIGVVESGINESDIPNTGGPVMMADAGLSATAFNSKLAGSRTMTSALNTYEHVVGGSEASPLDPQRPFAAFDKARETYASAASGAFGADVANAVNNATDDKQRVAALASAGLFDNPQAARDASVVAEALGRSGAQNVITGQNDADLDTFRRKFNLGHGLWLQRQVNNMSASPGAGYDPKAIGPLSGLGKGYSRQSQVQDWVQETLALL